ncbi:PHP domain-like protein [Mycena floridula]|nr:PHP domain-like protein [Mycena floridula]
MFFDLNVPVPDPQSNGAKKGKGKQPAGPPVFSDPQIAGIDARLDIMIHLGYNVICFNQTVHKKVDPKIHVNYLDVLLAKLKPRAGTVFLKRLTIILDEDSEKGFGLINANTNYFNSYDFLSLVPTNQATLSLACLTHSVPSPLTAHIISFPLTLPRPPFHLKHTLIRTAIKNGAVFEINYTGALGGESDPVLIEAGAAENGPNCKRNWWAGARELVRVTKGKNIIVSGGVAKDEFLRAPGDVVNLISLLDLPQDVAHGCMTKVPQSLGIRAATRRTYRAVLSMPKVVVPEGYVAPETPTEVDQPGKSQMQKKRAREDVEMNTVGNATSANTPNVEGSPTKKKRKKNKQSGQQP